MSGFDISTVKMDARHHGRFTDPPREKGGKGWEYNLYSVTLTNTADARRARVFQGSFSGRVYNVTGAVSDLTSLQLTKTDWLSVRGHGYSALDDIKARLERVLGVPVTVDTL